TPKNCSSRSAPNAPTMPIQFRATRELVSAEALLSEGSSGEYEASARKRRSAETHNRNPSSSFSRRLFVGLKMRAMNFIGGTVVWPHCSVARAPSPANGASRRHSRTNATTPERHNYRKKQTPRQRRSLGQYRVSAGAGGALLCPGQGAPRLHSC